MVLMLPLKFLNGVGEITEWDPFEWCQWLFSSGKTPEGSDQGDYRFDDATFCGLVWYNNCNAFRCQTCAYSENMLLCSECFHEGDHEGHEFEMYRGAGGGFCDCGDKNMLRETGFCPRHGLHDEPNPLPEANKDVLCVAEALRSQLYMKLVEQLRKTYCRTAIVPPPMVSFETYVAKTFMPHLFSRLVQYLQKSYDQCNCGPNNAAKEIKVFSSHTAKNSAIGKASESGTSCNKPLTDLHKPEKSRTVSQDLEEVLLNESYLSDFTLKVGDRTFHVHKAVLGARSKFFRATFDSEMKEMQDNCMVIKDRDGDTLQRMLQFVYSDTLDNNMGWVEACRLYDAANFYDLELLKQGCSKILKKTLCVPSALEVLELADLHQDRKLKSAAVDFIFVCGLEFLDSEDWITFQEENPRLALVTFRELFSKKMKA